MVFLASLLARWVISYLEFQLVNPIQEILEDSGSTGT